MKGDSYKRDVKLVPPVRSSILTISLGKQGKHEAHGNEETQGLTCMEADLDIL